MRVTNQNPNSSADKCFMNGHYTLTNDDGHLDCAGDLTTKSVSGQMTPVKTSTAKSGILPW
jgi:hypothetical protein